MELMLWCFKKIQFLTGKINDNLVNLFNYLLTAICLVQNCLDVRIVLQKLKRPNVGLRLSIRLI